GTVTLMHQFRGEDSLSRIRLWLQHVCRVADAFHYLENLGFPVGDCHSHHRCIPSAMLNEEGRLIIDASDFCDSNLGCFQSCLRTLCDEENGTVSPGEDYAYDDNLVSQASKLLSVLRPSTGKGLQGLDVDQLINSDLGKL
ncbi:hypothetical protein BD309DRAFT_862598, partial [Dichomitus squalens]